MDLDLITTDELMLDAIRGISSGLHDIADAIRLLTERDNPLIQALEYGREPDAVALEGLSEVAGQLAVLAQVLDRNE
jgi:hypothetical protein